jgi:hypothetical protein
MAARCQRRSNFIDVVENLGEGKKSLPLVFFSRCIPNQGNGSYEGVGVFRLHMVVRCSLFVVRYSGFAYRLDRKLSPPGIAGIVSLGDFT